MNNESIKQRPPWDLYYLTIAFVIAQRSFDPSSRCGTILVSKNNNVLSTGYNGPLVGSIDEEIPLDRPEKYYHMIHGEENALLAYNGSRQDIQGATAYVTGRPCYKCLRMLIQKGIRRVVWGPNKTKVLDEADLKAQEIMLRHHPDVKMVDLSSKWYDIHELLGKTDGYISDKVYGRL